MKHLLCLVILVCLLPSTDAFAQEEKPSPRPPVLKLATYNIKNLVDVFDNPYTRDEGTVLKPRKDIEAVANSVRSINADIIAFTEIENEQVLKAVTYDYLGDMGYNYVVAGDTNDGRGMRVGVISRLPIISTTSYKFTELTLPKEKRTWTFARDLTQVRLQVTEQQTLDLFVVHFKSRRHSSGDKNSTKWRTAEAAATLRIIDRLLTDEPDRWVVLAGDLNAILDSPARKILLAPDKSGKHILHDVHDLLAKDNRITFPNPAYASVLDYILVSKAMQFRLVKDSPWVGSVLAGSDRLPIAATFQLD
jgi:endonuclease/exonuclease/phosphatase family metal-dependent hydrolase